MFTSTTIAFFFLLFRDSVSTDISTSVSLSAVDATTEVPRGTLLSPTMPSTKDKVSKFQRTTSKLGQENY